MNLSIIKAVHTAMREHLINLLYQEYKQKAYLKKIEETGIHFKELEAINNWSIVLDFIGFPKDGDEEWSFLSSDNVDENNIRFSRNELHNNYLQTLKTIPAENKLTISKEGFMVIENTSDTQSVKAVLAHHVEWLFNEYEKLLELAPH